MKPMHTQYSAPPTHHADLLAYRQSQNPMAQTADSQPSQTLHVESEQTTSERLRKRPTQLNTPNIFVPDLVRVSPNASDVTSGYDEVLGSHDFLTSAASL